MKKIFILVMAALLTSAALVSCTDKTEAKTESSDVAVESGDVKEEEVMPEGFSYYPDKVVGYWETTDDAMMGSIHWGYRFNEDGTLDYVEDRMYNPVGIYECREDGVHYSPDNGETWDDLVMIIKSQSDTEMVVDFDGTETVFTKYDGEITEYVPEGWSYVEGTDEEINSAS